MDQTSDLNKTRVFISYSRKDQAFADILFKSLTERGYTALIDREDILPGEPWQNRLEITRLFLGS